ncbi:hypothetical protein HO173_001292 [Letharia columbiana]|uniref:Uncharacterized protein n=1 Tax=Letharia columbiana TaxID=112416 RepID=A0A8H6L9M3_9LECA|nr:uncharacterized protein HO173_001292 [Letharia columbiana]KAF6240621.1 hypothetical protein HO173_001292 [Letharia columbiana]
MDFNMGCYPILSFEIRDYYEKVSKGLIEERPYDYWGPESEEEKAHWRQWCLPIKKSFRPIDWDSGFTGRGIVKNKENAMERPGLVGPLGEMFVVDVDPLSDAIVWRIDSSSSSEAEVGKGRKKQKRSSFEAANKMYKRVKEHFAALT